MTTKENAAPSELISKFIAFETQNNLFGIEIKGHKFWDYIRYTVLSEIFFREYSFEWRARDKGRYFYYFKELFVFTLSSVKNLFRTLTKKHKKHDIVVVGYDRTNYIDNKLVNISFYPIIQRLKKNYKVLYVDPCPLDYDAKSAYECDIIKSREHYIYDKLRSKLVTYSKNEINLFNDLSKQIKEKIGIDIDIYSTVKTVFSLQLIKYKRFRSILKAHKPSLVIYADDGHQRGLIDAAHSLGSTAIDFQHSQVSDVHYVYCYPKDIKKYDLTTLSDYVFTFGEYWHDKFRMPIKKVPVGFPYLNLKKAEVSEKYQSSDNKKNIIIISDHVSMPKYSEIAIGLAKQLPDHNIFYKLRSEDCSDWQNRYPEEFTTLPNIEVIDNNDKTLYEYFFECSYQIGVNSTALYEGLAFNLTTFILKDGWYEGMIPLINNDYAFLIETADDIVNKIKGNIKPNNLSNIDKVFMKNSLTNIENEITHIYNNGLQ